MSSRSSRWLGVAVLVAAGGLAVAACGGSSSTSSGASSSTTAKPSSGESNPAKSVSITITNYSYSPNHDTVSPGAKIIVTNKDSVTHTLTSTTGKFDTGLVMPNQSKTITAPTTAGAYPYRCTIHPFMTGTLTVR